jgi:hypothetical protein
MSAFEYYCSACGDYRAVPEHECWVRLKMATQEVLPEPEPTAPPVDRWGDVA